jgi:hypothetical protein
MPDSKLAAGARLQYGPLAKLSAGVKAGYDLARVGVGLSRGPNQTSKTVAAAWSNTWPAPGATLDLDFANNRGFVRGVGQGGVMDAITFTRASIGKYVDSSGIVQDATNNAPRFDWASTAQVAQNVLLYTDDFSNAVWSKTGCTATAGEVTGTANTTGIGVTQSISTTANANARFEIKLKAGSVSKIRLRPTNVSNTYLAEFDLSAGTVNTATSDALASGAISGPDADGYYTCAITVVGGADMAGLIGISGLSAFGSTTISTPNSGLNFFVKNANLQVTDSTSTLAYFANGAFAPTNAPLQATTTCNGLLIEESRTNRLLWCRDATQTNWTKTSVTATKNQTGIDGVANAASSLTASADGGTCIQTITLASGSRTGSVYLKRITGTGNVQVSLDGSTWSTVDLSNGLWNRIVLSGTVTNPVVGIKLATNGDAVAMDYGQVEDGAFVTTPILTTTATATRAVDSASITGTTFLSFYSNNKSSSHFLIATGSASWSTLPNAAVMASIDNNTTTNRFGVGRGIVSTVPVAYATVLSSNAGPTFTLGGWPSGTTATIALSFNDANSAVCDSNKITQLDTTTKNPVSVTQLQIGFRPSGSVWNGCVSRISYGPSKLTDKGLQAMTGGTT